MRQHYTIIVAALLAMLATVLPASAQQQQDALYIYRNDGGFNAFFFRDIERIAYSRVDTLGVEQDDYVVQEVYALDTLYRIPLSAIDSVAFVAPETQYRADVAFTTESSLWDYVTATDSTSWLLLRSDTPASLVPQVGDKLVTLNQTPMLPAGFAGRVTAVATEAGGLRVSCGKVALTEVFDRYLCKVDAVVESDGQESRLVRRDAEWKDNESIALPTMAETLHLTGSYGLSDEFSLDGNGYVGLAVTPSVELRLFLAVDAATGINLDMTMRGQMDTQLQFGFNGVVTGTFDVPLVKTVVPIPACPIIMLKAEAGVFTQAQGSINIGGTYTTTDRLYSLTQFNSLSEGGRQATLSFTHVKDTLEWSSVTGKVTVNFGGYCKLSIVGADDDIAEVGVRAEAGLREELEADLKMDDYKWVVPASATMEAIRLATQDNQAKARALYDNLDRNVSVNYALFVNGQAFGKIGPWQITEKAEATMSQTPKGGLVPHFGKTTYRLATAATDSVYLDTPLDRSTLFPVKVGYDVYNNQNQLVKEVVRSTPYTGTSEPLTMGVAGLTAGQKYIAYPRVDLFGITSYAAPTDSFTTDKPSLDIPVKELVTGPDNGHVDVTVSTNVTDIVFSTPDKWVSYFWNAQTQQLSLYYEALPMGQESRKATIKVVTRDGDGTIIDQAEITLAQLRTTIELSTTELTMGVKGGAAVITITSTNAKDIEATSKSNFLHPTASGNTISILVDENTSTEAREGTVIVSGVLEATGLRVERFISVKQDGTLTPQASGLFYTATITGPTSSVYIDTQEGTTTRQGNLLVYRSGNTNVATQGKSKTEESWQAELVIDPAGDTSLRHYRVVSGSVSYLKNYYYTTLNADKEESHQQTTRWSFNLKDLKLAYFSTSSLTFRPDTLAAGSNLATTFISDFSYQRTLDGKPQDTRSQADLAEAKADDNLSVWLFIASDVPVLEWDRDSIHTDSGSDDFSFVSYSNNDLVTNIEVTTSDAWLTYDAGRVNWTVNDSKQQRKGFVYLTGTLADGSKLTRTLTVTQAYERIWDDEWTTTADEKAELPSEAVLAALQAHGMPLYTGTNPPAVSGAFQVKPLKLLYSSQPEDYYDSADGVYYVFGFESQTGENPRARLGYYVYEPTYDWTSPAEQMLCYLGGDGNNFTVSNITSTTEDSPIGVWTITYVTIISGEVDGNTIKNLHYAYVLFDDKGEISNLAIITDGDDVSTAITWAPGTDWDDESGESRRLLRKALRRLRQRR